MNAQERALVRVAEHLGSLGIPYMVIGGMANAVWGVPRATLDVDVTVWVEPARPSQVVEGLARGFRLRVKEPGPFADETRVLPMETPEGVAVDVVFGLLPFEHDAIGRAVERLVSGRAIRFASAEDLVLMKIISDRARDAADVEQILIRQREHLDRAYLDPRIDELAQILDRPDLRARYREAMEDTE